VLFLLFFLDLSRIYIIPLKLKWKALNYSGSLNEPAIRQRVSRMKWTLSIFVTKKTKIPENAGKILKQKVHKPDFCLRHAI
jgi:hypothetical protein